MDIAYNLLKLVDAVNVTNMPSQQKKTIPQPNLKPGEHWCSDCQDRWDAEHEQSD